VALTNDLEIFFRQAWFLLYSQGVSEGYVKALTAFVQAGIGAYDAGYSLPALNLELLADQKVTGDEALDRFIQLDPEEVNIRTVWLTLIYLTLAHCRQAVLPEAEEGLVTLVKGVCTAHREGYTLGTLKLEMLFEGNARPPQESAILSQWMRLVFLTLDNMTPDGAK